MPSKRKKKPAAPKPRWERPGQTTAEFLAEVERRTRRPFGMSQDGVDYLDNLMEYSIKVERDANEAIRSGDGDAEFHVYEKAFSRGIKWAVVAIRKETTISKSKL